MKSNILFTALMILVCGQLLAAAPMVVNYQGRLATAGGVPVADGSYSVVFTIYDAPSGGANMWTETQFVTTSKGTFTVLLGTATPITENVFSGSSRYLGVRVGADPELAPRIRLGSVPYANRVSTVDGSTGGNITGNLNLDNSTAATGNILKGSIPFIHNFGTNNTAVGLNAGNSTMSGTDNTITGALALQYNTSGTQNTAIGVSSLHLNTSGNYNTAAGLNALYHNTTGSGNAAFGHLALLNNTDGNSNSAFGKDALFSNISGDSNTATGFQALFYNISGSENTANGFQALLFNTGNANTADGFQALLYNTNGTNNTADGYQALFNNNVGSSNTASGSFALYTNGWGYSNTAVGMSAMYLNGSGTENTAVGGGALYKSNGTGNTAIGLKALYDNASGSSNTAIGSYANVGVGNLVNATAIGANAVVNTSNKVRLGNDAVTIVEGQVAYSYFSDMNQKENFQPVDGAEVLKKVSGLSATSWNYKNQDAQKFRHYGPMAQEFYEAFGHDGFGQSGDSTSINSGDMAGIMMIAIQTLEKRTAEIQTLKKQSAELTARLDKMEAILNKIACDETGNNVRLGQK